MPSAAENRPKTRTIVICHIDSLCCLPALNAVFAEFGNDIGLVLSSRRFGSSHGTFWEQTTAGFRRFGVPLNLWLGFDLISVPIVAFFARWLATSRSDGVVVAPELTLVDRSGKAIAAPTVPEAARVELGPAMGDERLVRWGSYEGLAPRDAVRPLAP